MAEKGIKPNVNIFEYPSLKLHRILRDGTEEAYAHLDFSPKGDKLASVGSAPDYMLTVWDWKNEQVILRSKAFSQDVYKVAFSPEDEGHLCTSGSGHIRCVASPFPSLQRGTFICAHVLLCRITIKGFQAVESAKGCRFGL